MLIQYIELKKNLTRKLELNELKHELKKRPGSVSSTPGQQSCKVLW